MRAFQATHESIEEITDEEWDHTLPYQHRYSMFYLVKGRHCRHSPAGASDYPFLEHALSINCKSTVAGAVSTYATTKGAIANSSLRGSSQLFCRFVSRYPAQFSQLRRFLMLHPLEHDSRSIRCPLEKIALASCANTPLNRPPPVQLRKKYAGIVHPPNMYACLLTLPYLAITGSLYVALRFFQ